MLRVAANRGDRGMSGMMQRVLLIVTGITLCSLLLISDGWAAWHFSLPWRNDGQAKINHLEKQLRDEKQLKEDAQIKINDLENQLQYERQMTESLQAKAADLEKQLQEEILIKESAQKDAAAAEASRHLWMGISAAIALGCLLVGIAMAIKIRKAAKNRFAAGGNDDLKRV